MLRRQI